MSVRVTFEIPSDTGGEPQLVTVDGQKGQSILDIALAHDVPLQHACGGFCACTTCHVHVRAGAEHLGEMQEEEAERIEAAERYGAPSRLGCQAPVLGDVTVAIINVDG